MFQFFDRYNPADYRARIGDKSLSPKYYSQFLNREQIDRAAGFDRFIDYCSRYKTIFIKRKIGWGGESAQMLPVQSREEINAAWDALTEDYVAEPYIENCDFLKRIYPGSLNTMKLTVLQTKNGPLIVTAIIRFGNHTVVDNVHSGGMAAGVNIETGQIETLAVNKHFQKYSHHPETNQPIMGATIPKWEEIKKLAVDASAVTPQLRYTSWDIALTEGGPIMIEGNWDAEFYPEQTIYNRGHRQLFTELLEGTL